MENEKELQWQAPDNHHLPKNQEFLVAASVGAIALIVFAILTRNYLFILLIAIAAFLIYASLKKGPGLNHFKLTDRGLFIDKKFYPYNDFESFWIFDQSEIHEVALRSKRRFAPILLIPLYNIDSEEVAEFLARHIEIKEEEESLIDIFRKRYF